MKIQLQKMILLALKGEVSCEGYSKSCLMFKSPAMLALLNIVLNCFSCNIANRSVKLTCRPKVSCTEKGFTQTWKLVQYPISRYAFKQLHYLTYRIMWRKTHKQMHMVRLDINRDDVKVVFVCNPIKGFQAFLFYATSRKILKSALRYKD